MANINKITVGGVTYNITLPAGLTEEEQAQIRENIGAISAAEADVVSNGTYPEMTVGNATHAQTADNAQNAVSDEMGRNIPQTYLTKQQALDLFLPVGKHWIQYQGESTPAALFGGTWEADTDYTGRVLVGSGAGYALGATGGEATHILTVAEMPRHTHSFPGQMYWGQKFAQGTNFWGMSDAVTDQPFTLYETGDSQPHNIMQPYKVVAVWKRTA
ncbi:MAG: hypothetical protein OSJ39_00545 [Clostridia bacterium]|nr:hypothetical protein [Clostridia bacterium]